MLNIFSGANLPSVYPFWWSVYLSLLPVFKHWVVYFSYCWVWEFLYPRDTSFIRHRVWKNFFFLFCSLSFSFFISVFNKSFILWSSPIDHFEFLWIVVFYFYTYEFFAWVLVMKNFSFVFFPKFYSFTNIIHFDFFFGKVWVSLTISFCI